MDLSDLLNCLENDDNTKEDLFNELDYKFNTDEIEETTTSTTTTIYNERNNQISNNVKTVENTEIDKVENIQMNISMQCLSLQNKSIDSNINNNNDYNHNDHDTLETKSNVLETKQFERIKTLKQKTIFEERKLWVYDLIAKKIGSKWRLFGGGIGMKEGDMDKLENRFDNIRTRVHKMFDQLEIKEYYNYDKIYYQITHSLLEECNVRALKDEIEFAMTK